MTSDVRVVKVLSVLEILFLLAAVLVCAGTASCRTLYVDQQHPQASDANPGTAALPFQTIGAAAATVSPGDTVLVRPGVYRESVTVGTGGTGPSQLVTFRADPPRQAVVDGADVITGFEAAPGRPGVYRRPETRPMSAPSLISERA